MGYCLRNEENLEEFNINFFAWRPLLLLAEAYGDESTQRINVTYFMIRNMRLIRPVIRRYIRTQVETLYLRIPLDDMLIGILLPVQQFRTGPLDSMSNVINREVWRDSRGIVTNA